VVSNDQPFSILSTTEVSNNCSLSSTNFKKNAAVDLPAQHTELGELIAIDGSLIDSVLSMHWAEYRTNVKKAKLHLGFNLNNGILRKLFLTEGTGAEKTFCRQDY
jgi:hypothetical protein